MSGRKANLFIAKCMVNLRKIPKKGTCSCLSAMGSLK